MYCHNPQLIYLLLGTYLICFVPLDLVAQIKKNEHITHLLRDSIADDAYSKLNHLLARSNLPYTPIIIIHTKNKRTPLSTKPSLSSILKSKEKRTYIITISTYSTPFLYPILYPQLSDEARYGVLAHELSHALYFQALSTWQLFSIPLNFLSGKAIDKFEKSTDKYCIELGYGHELLAWSEEVRQKLNIFQWRGAKANYHSAINQKAPERYLNPSTIKELLQEDSIVSKESFIQ